MQHPARGARDTDDLHSEGVLVVSGGMSFHTMRSFTPAFATASRRFDDWLTIFEDNVMNLAVAGFAFG